MQLRIAIGLAVGSRQVEVPLLSMRAHYSAPQRQLLKGGAGCIEGPDHWSYQPSAFSMMTTKS
jgi:hypothetical protein